MADAESSRLESLRKQVAKSRALKAQGVKFEVADDPMNKNQKVVIARQGGKVLGEMTLYPESDKTNFKGVREIRQVWTDPSAQRQGVATSLFNEAKKLGLKPVHSSQLTKEGAGFAKAVDGPKAPPRPWQEQVLRTQAMDKKEIKNVTRSAGQERARAIAKLRAEGKAAEVSTPQARRNLRLPSAANVPLGNTLGILGFLPMLAEGGRIMQGKFNPMTRGGFRG
jgi:predicted N-acetyltransferase YhbS